MKSSTISILIAVMIGAIGILLLVNFFSMVAEPPKERFIAPGEVKGITVTFDGKEVSPNFKQQTEILAILNQSVRLKPDVFPTGDIEKLPYTKITILRFDQPDIEIEPIHVVNNQLIFSCKEWNPEGLLREVGPGNLNALLKSLNKK
jgi:hypothetical protein